MAGCPTYAAITTMVTAPRAPADLNRHVAELPASGQSNPADFYQAGPAIVAVGW